MTSQEEIEKCSLSGLGAMVVAKMAGHEVSDEILRRVPDTIELESLLDYHWVKWKKSVTSSKMIEAYLELRALMCGYAERHKHERFNSINKEILLSNK